MTMELLLLTGAVAGLIVGLTFRNERVGCIVLILLPICAIIYVAIDQTLRPEALTPFSGADYVSDPLWLSIGALPGYVAGLFSRSVFIGRDP